MLRFLVDANLPYYFLLWRSNEFVHVFDLNDRWTDNELWDYAKKHHLTILTKDADFSNRILFSQPPPKVIHLRLGNLKMRDFFAHITKNWNDILSLNSQNKLVNVYLNRIEAIN